MKLFQILTSGDPSVQGLLRLLGGEERALLLLDAGGYALWQTDAAKKLFDLAWGEPVMAALSGEAAHAVAAAARDRTALQLRETFDDVPYRLRACPVEEGLLLLAEPLAEAPGVSRLDLARSIQEANVLSSMTLAAHRGAEHAQDGEARQMWAHMERLIARARRIHLHGEIADGVPRLNEYMEPLDLAALCRETAAAAEDRLGARITVPGGALVAVMCREGFQFVLLGLLVSAAKCGPRQIAVGLRRGGGRIYLQVADDRAVPGGEDPGAVLSGWQGGASGCSAAELSRLGLELPAVQALLGRWGGSLFADAEGGMTRFTAVFPDDLPADPAGLGQEGFCSGIGDLVSLELSALE